MTSQTLNSPKKKRICECLALFGKIRHYDYCPLYTLHITLQPNPQKEPLFDCSGCSDPNSEGTHQGHSKQHGCVGCLHNESPQPKEPETLGGLKNLIRTRIESEYRKYHNYDKEMFFECVTGKLAASFVEKLKKESLSAAAEERKRVCEEMKKEINKLPLPYFDKGKTDDTFDEYVARSKGFDQLHSDVLSILNKYCE